MVGDKKTDAAFNRFFGVVLETERARRHDPPGKASGGAENAPASSDGWLFVVSGQGEATVAGERVALTAHSLLVTLAGEGHEICNTGDVPLETLNFYTSPEY